jgi:hypothetical protein
MLKTGGDQIIRVGTVLRSFFSYSILLLLIRKEKKVSTDLRECDNRAEWRGKKLSKQIGD